MLSRLNLLTRHFSRPFGSSRAFVSLSTPSLTPRPTSFAMTSARAKTIHTAACLIIGDEVLGGKVTTIPIERPPSKSHILTTPMADHRHQLPVPSQVLLLPRNAVEASRSHPR